MPRKSPARNGPHPALEKQARERLLEAGLDEFGKHGLQAATIRSIAGRAGVNIALISYYFGGKQGLYRAVVGNLADHMQAHLAPALQEMAEGLAGTGETGSQRGLALLLKLMDQIIDLMLGSPQAPRFARIILREQMHPSSAYDIIYHRVMQPVLQAIARSLSIAAARPLAPEIRLRALALIGQIMVFRVARETVVRMSPSMQGYSPAETEQIGRIILEQTEGIVRALVQEAKPAM